MARKIRFGLNMSGKQNIRTMEELKQNFDFKAVLEYYFNGKLSDWLNDRGYKDIAEQVAALDSEKDDFEESLCKIFGAEYTAAATAEDVEALVDRKEEIRKYTDDVEILENVGSVALTQEELNTLVKIDGKQTVYLIGKEFTLNGLCINKTYIGLNNPQVKFINLPEQGLDKAGIKVAGVRIIGDVVKVKLIEAKKPASRRSVGSYKVSPVFDFMLNDAQRKQSEKLYDCIVRELGGYKFDPDIKSDKLLKVVEESNLKGYFQNYLDRMA